MDHDSNLSIIRAIKELMAWDWIVKVFHIYREANQCADILAKKGHSIATGVTLFESAPAFLSHVFFGDISRAH